MTQRDETNSSHHDRLNAAIAAHIEAQHAAEEASIRRALTEYIKRAFEERGPIANLPDHAVTELAGIAVEALAEFYRASAGPPSQITPGPNTFVAGLSIVKAEADHTED